MFGEFVKKIRLERNLSLREFCRRIEEDPSNWSKIERGKMHPPKDKESLTRIAKVLEIKTDTDAWKMLFDYSQISSGNIPDYIMDNKEILENLPIFFRTIDNIKPNKNEIEIMIENLKKSL